MMSAEIWGAREMIGKSTAVLVSIFALGACATSQPETFLAGERTVFDNPYVAPELVERGVGAGRGGLFYPGAGRYAFDQDGNRVELSRAQLRSFRERAEIIREQAEQSEALKDLGSRRTDFALPSQPTGGSQ